MDNHLDEVAILAENNEDCELQFESEVFLDESLSRLRDRQAILDWIAAEAETYLPADAERPVDESEIEKLAQEVGF